MGNYIQDSLDSLLQSASVINALPFKQTQVFTLAVLSPEDWFETHLIRDAEPHELSLFRPARYEEQEDKVDEKWTATKRPGPERVGGWEKASPLKEKRGNDDPARCLLAAKRLLDVYPLPRATEHVQALYSQYEGLIESILDLEESLKRPIPRLNPQSEASLRAAELEEAIKREHMEIFALEQIISEKQAEAQSQASRPTKSANSKPPPPPESQSNPFGKSTLLDRRVPASSRPAVARPTPPSATPPITPKKIRPVVSSVPSPAPSPKAVTPRKAPSVETTPRATRTATAKVASPAGRKEKKTVGISGEGLEAVAAKVWAGVGEMLRPWARKTLLRQGEEVPSSLTELPFHQTLQTLSTILTAPPAPLEPSSPHSIASSYTTLTSEADDADPPSPAPPSLLEFELLNLLLSTLSGSSPLPSPLRSASSPPLPPLGITMRDAVLASSLAGGGAMGVAKKEEPMVSMNKLKVWLGAYAKERGWAEDMATTAIYSLVAKTVLRIDRRGKEGPMLGFRQ